MLCGISVVFNSLGDVFALVGCQRGSENQQVLMGFQSTEALGRFQQVKSESCWINELGMR